jgi:hypothetical protein
MGDKFMVPYVASRRLLWASNVAKAAFGRLAGPWLEKSEDGK